MPKDFTRQFLDEFQMLKRRVEALEVLEHTSKGMPVLVTYIDIKARGTEANMHGGLAKLDDNSPLSTGTDIVATAGIGKIMVAVLGGNDIDGEITVTGISVDRETGAETGADTDTLTVDALTTDDTHTDGVGVIEHEFTGAYITSKWFRGEVTLSTTTLDLTDVDTYQVSFEQLNDRSRFTLDTLDITAFASSASAWFDAHFYALEVTGDKCNITPLADIELPAASVEADKYYRLRRGNIGKVLNGTTDGFWVDVTMGPDANNFWEDVTLKVWTK